MIIKMTNHQMEQAGEALSKYTSTTGRIGYAVARNLQALQTAVTPYLAVKQTIIKDYSRPDPKCKGRFIVVPEKRGEMAELMAIEVDVDVYQIDEDTFLSWGLTAEEMAPLIWMVKE